MRIHGLFLSCGIWQIAGSFFRLASGRFPPGRVILLHRRLPPPPRAVRIGRSGPGAPGSLWKRGARHTCPAWAEGRRCGRFPRLGFQAAPRLPPPGWGLRRASKGRPRSEAARSDARRGAAVVGAGPGGGGLPSSCEERTWPGVAGCGVPGRGRRGTGRTAGAAANREAGFRENGKGNPGKRSAPSGPLGLPRRLTCTNSSGTTCCQASVTGTWT